MWRLRCRGNVGGGGTVPYPCRRRGDLGSGRGQGSPVCPLREKGLSETPDEAVGPREEGGSPGRRVGALRGWWEFKRRVGIQCREPR